MRDQELIAALSPSAAVAATLFALGYDHSPLDRAAIASVIVNRSKAQRADWGLTVKDAALHPEQFTCWAPSDGCRYGSAMDAARHFHAHQHAGRVSKECVELARMAVLNILEDVTDGAVAFLPRYQFESDGPPGWVVGKLPCFATNAFAYFRNIDR